MSHCHTVLLTGCGLLLAASATHAQPQTPSGTGGTPIRSPDAQPSERSRPKPAADIQEDVDQEQASHIEIAPLPVAFGKLNSVRLRADGNLLATDIENDLIKILSPAGEVLKTLQPGFAPEIIQLTPEGQMYCAGDGRVARLSEDGEVVIEAKLPEQPESSTGPRRGGSRPPGVSGLAVSPDAVFVSFGSGWSVSSKARLYRYDRNLENPVMLAEGLRGCCQHCDLVFREGILYLAENAAFRVVQCDTDGKVLAKWGSKGRGELERFGSCCNPMNLAFDAAGVLYTGESGMGRVKRYTTEGQFLGLVGYLDTERFNRGSRLAAACCYFPLAVTPDGDRVYVADVKDNVIRVLDRKPTE